MRLTFFAWCIAICWACPAFGVDEAKTEESLLARTTLYVGDKVLDKLVEAGANKLVNQGWDAAFGSDQERVFELDRRLNTYQSLLEKLAEGQGRLGTADSEQAAVSAEIRAQLTTQAASIAELRDGLNSKTTPAEVRKIVNQSLGMLRSRVEWLRADVGNLEQRADKIDDRLKRIEDLFGRIPYAPPTPLIQENALAPPKAHPLTRQWLDLLVRSEASRVELADLRRLYPDTSSRMREPLAEDAKILAETAALREKVTREFDEAFQERERLLQEFLPTSPRLVQFDEQVASVFWLMAVTTPVEGRLGVPPAFFGRQASEMMIAFKLSGVEPEQVAELYSRQFLAEESEYPRYQVSLLDEYSKEMMTVAEGLWTLLGVEAPLVHGRWSKTLENLQEAVKKYSPIHPDVVALRKEYHEYVPTIRELHLKLREELDRATAMYLGNLHLERPGHPRMKAFRNGVLQPLVSWVKLTAVPADPTSEELQAMGQAFLAVKDQLWFYPVRLRLYDVPAYGKVFSPDQRYAAASELTEDKVRQVRTWNVQTGETVSTFSDLPGSVESLEFGPQGRFLAVKLYDKDAPNTRKYSVSIYDLEKDALVLSDSIPRFQLPPFSQMRDAPAEGGVDLLFTPDAKLIIAGTHESEFHVWDVASGQLKYRIKPSKHIQSVPGLTKDGSRIVLFHEEKSESEITVWDLEEGQLVYSMPVGTLVGVDIDNSRIVGQTEDRDLTLWNLDSGRLLKTLPNDLWGLQSPLKIWFGAEGKSLTIVDGARAVTWNLDTGELNRQVDFEYSAVEIKNWLPESKELFIETVQRDRELSRDIHRFELIDLATGRCRMSLLPHIGFLNGRPLFPVSLTERTSVNSKYGYFVWDFRMPKG